MDKIGTVIKLENNNAIVQVMRASACGENCAMCKGGCSQTKQTVSASNEMGALLGDKVKIELDDNKVLLAAFLVYILPLILLIIGYVIKGWQGAVIGFVIPFIILKALDKKNAKRYTATITKIWERLL